MPASLRQSADRPVGPLVASLTGVRQSIRRFRLVWACVTGLTVFAAVLAVGESLERWIGLREGTALLVVAGALLFAFVLALRNGFRALFQTPSVKELALGVEAAHPELLDSFVCAVELESSGRSDFGPLEEVLLARTRDHLRVLDLPAIFHRALPWRRLVLLALLVASAVGVLGQARVVRKARFQLGDWRRGTHTGLTLEYPREPVPEHSNVRLEVTVNRWESDASILYEDADGSHRFPLNQTPGGGQHFTFYDVAGRIRFRIETPSLRSAWQSVESFTPPAFEAVALRIRQPAYTGREDLVFAEFRNATAVMGSRIELTVATRPGTEATVHSEGVQPMQAGAPGTFHFAQTLAENFVFRVRLHTPEGFRAFGPETTILGEPDLPPVIEVVEPRRDVQALAKDTVYLEALASDDFGIARVVLRYTISGGEPQILVLHETPGDALPEAETSVGEKLDLGELKVKDGDVISYAFLATDNRDPAPQTARSHVFFITVRPSPEDAGEQEGEGQKSEVDLGALIAELKRIIRLTWDQLDVREREREVRREELHRALKDLAIETRSKMNEILEATQGQGGDTVREAFAMIEREILRAAGMIEKNLIEEALPPEERALAMLVAIENELLKNAMKSQGEGKQQNESEKEPPEKDAQPNNEQGASQAQAMARIREALEQVRRLAQRQDGQNRELERAPDTLDQPLADALGDKQDDIGNTSGDIRRSLADLADAEAAVADLASAEREMQRSRQALGNRNLPAARPYGARAHQGLLAAVRSLEAAQRKQAAERIEQLAQFAQQLSDAQGQAADQSRQFSQSPQPDPGQVGAARERQRQIQTLNDRLEQAIEQTAGEFGETFPQASRALAEAAREAREAGTSGTMTRAANALLYKRFDHARREQDNAANELLKLAENLSEAGQHLPTMSREELLEAMRELQGQAQGVQQAMQQGDEQQARNEMARQSAQGARSLEQLANALQDETLQRIADDMSRPQRGENPEAEGMRLLGMYRAALRVMEQHLLAAGLERKLDLSRESANPPERYRRLVEQYFKNLSREK